MPAIASLEDLQAVQRDLQQLQQDHPQAYTAFIQVFRSHRKVGYKNISKLMLGESTPEKLKGVQ